MEAQSQAESWASGAAYEPFIGRWSRRIAHDFLRWLPWRSGAQWLEIGCGTGALTHRVMDMADPTLVLATDRSAAYVKYAQAHRPAGPVHFAVGDATRLPLRPGVADVVMSGLLLNFLPVPAAGVVEMARLARVGGLVAAYVWDYAGRMELLRIFWDTVIELDPAAASLDEGRRFPLCAPQALEQLWQDTALVDVQSSAIEVATPFRNFEDYWHPFLGGQGPAPAYVASLDEPRREILRERLRGRLPIQPGGEIDLRARAWAVRGRRAA